MKKIPLMFVIAHLVHVQLLQDFCSARPELLQRCARWLSTRFDACRSALASAAFKFGIGTRERCVKNAKTT
jgi:hypothetical protein